MWRGQFASEFLYYWTEPFIHDQRMRNQEKSQRNPESILIKDKTIGLLGYGPINQFAHDFLKGFDVDFAILKRSWNDEDV